MVVTEELSIDVLSSPERNVTPWSERQENDAQVSEKKKTKQQQQKIFLTVHVEVIQKKKETV